MGRILTILIPFSEECLLLDEITFGLSGCLDGLSILMFTEIKELLMIMSLMNQNINSFHQLSISVLKV
jgi:hypothetical protein